MLQLARQAGDAAGVVPPASGYVPGVCNIGPDEVARRRRSGHAGVLASIGLFAILVAIDAPSLARLLVALPATIAASGYLQAHLRFCAGFGSAGVFNFGSLGSTQKVDDADARRRDRATSLRIGVASFLIGAVVGITAVLLPV
jgi:hypothetical protein